MASMPSRLTAALVSCCPSGISGYQFTPVKNLAGIATDDRVGDVIQEHHKQATIDGDAGYEQEGSGGLRRGGNAMGDRAAELVESCIGRIGRTGLAQQSRVACRGDGIALERGVAETD